MDGYKTFLRKDTTGWLIEDNNPSARYFALRDILDYPLDSPELISARREIMLRGPVPEIRKKQKATEYIKRERALLNAGRLFFKIIHFCWICNILALKPMLNSRRERKYSKF